MKVSAVKKLNQILDKTINESDRISADVNAIFSAGCSTTDKARDMYAYVQKRSSDFHYEELIADLMQISYTELEDAAYELSEMIDAAHKCLRLCIAASVFMEKLADLRLSSSENNDYVTFSNYLSSLALLQRSLKTDTGILHDLYENADDLWDLLFEDDGEEEEPPSEPLWEYDFFCDINCTLQHTLDYYMAQHPEVDLSEQKKFLHQAMDDFANGREPEEFSVSLVYHTEDETAYLDFYTDSPAITVSRGGSVYTPEVGGDSYTDWMFTFWPNATVTGTYSLNEEVIEDFINLGAKLTIEPSDDVDDEEGDE